MPCKWCDRPSWEHHKYEPIIPDGCKCNPRDWDEDIEEVCPAFLPRDTSNLIEGCDESADWCLDCNHPIKCHPKPLPLETDSDVYQPTSEVEDC